MSALTAADRLLAASVGLLALVLLAPWPRPSVSLRAACKLTDAGRFAVQCDLGAAAVRSGQSWLRKGIRVYQDGMLLRQADRAADVRRENPASYHTTGQLLTLTALDRSDPRTNGRAYVARPAEFDPLGLGQGRRRAGAAGLAAAAFLGYAFLRRRIAALLLGAMAIAVAGLLVQLAAVFSEAPVHVDAGYAIPAAEAVARGARPYATLLFNYTPLGVYEFAMWSLAWFGGGPASYAWYLALVVLNEVACASLLFLVLRGAGVAGGLSAVVAASFLSMTLWFDGGRVLFEPLYLLPALVAATLLSRDPGRRDGLPAGAAAAIAFLTKQYGGFALAGALLAQFFEGRDRLSRLAAIALGFSLALLALLGSLAAFGLDLRGFLVQSLGPSYPRRFETVWLQVFLWQCPIVVPALVVPFLSGAWSRRSIRVATCFGLASCLPFYFRQHQYYFLNLCPWLFLLFGLGVAHVLEVRPMHRRAALLAASLLLTSMPIRGAAAQASVLAGEVRSGQLRRARLMNDAWPAGLRTLMLAYPGFYQMTHYLSADEAAVGYRFLNEVTPAQLRRGFAAAAGAWIDPNSMYAREADRTLREAGTSLEEQLQQNGFTKKLVLEERFELWTKGP